METRSDRARDRVEVFERGVSAEPDTRRDWQLHSPAAAILVIVAVWAVFIGLLGW